MRELNRAFRGPRILFGYYQGGLLCRMLIEERGFPPMIRLLEAFDRGLDLDQALALVFDRTPEELDRQFDAWLVPVDRGSGDRAAPLERGRGAPAPAPGARAAGGRRGARALGRGLVQRGLGCLAGGRRGRRRGGPAASSSAPGCGRRARSSCAARSPSRAATARRPRRAGAPASSSAARISARAWRSGGSLLDAGDLAGAEQHFAAAERDFPGFDEPELSAELHLAQVYAHQERTEDLFRARERWLAWESDDFPLRVQVARWHAEGGRHERAAELFREANEIDPFHRELHVEWGRSLLALADHAAALREFDVALAVPGDLDPDLPGPLPRDLLAELGGLRAAALAGLGRTEEAAEAARAALELDPACAAARAALESL